MNSRKLRKKVEAKLKTYEAEEKAVIKILLLGAGQCGKSTVLKQMKIIHQGGFGQEEKMSKIQLVRSNTIDAIKILVQASLDFDIPLNDSKSNEYVKEVMSFDVNGQHTPDIYSTMGQKLAHLWANPSLQKVLKERSSEFTFPDSGGYFLKETSRCFAPDYLPSDQDILRTRLATIGIIETDFWTNSAHFRMYDVGGQRGERKKWIHCFEGVRAVLFITSLSEYDQVLEEDRTRNRMQESLKLFEGITNLPWFKTTAMILFLNKNDIFQEKVKRIDIGIYFNSYVGGLDYECGLLFIKEEYTKRNHFPDKHIYIHVTDATSTDNIKAVWNITKHITLNNSLKESGLLL
eukprot:CAMPEP_0175150206 /NCGR_PEP_ID=MMETSP0087-20121206/17731_1 /TAXON_ID=136419 /ORGANISM="Unknown Unknown, Strain D1" /LENGTH=347 /DNA_ID=CAMNT_0016436105 /DNA_START=1 /DNA_END=1044 /DNA_ORIENTATION=+